MGMLNPEVVYLTGIIQAKKHFGRKGNEQFTIDNGQYIKLAHFLISTLTHYRIETDFPAIHTIRNKENNLLNPSRKMG